MSDYGFVLSGMALPGGADPLGVCRIAPGGDTAPEALMAFAAKEGAAPSPAIPVWRVQLPDSPADADAVLSASAAAVRRADAALTRVQTEFAAFTPIGAYASEPFALQRDTLRITLASFSESAAESYGIGDLFKKKPEPSAEYREDTDQWQTFVQQIEQMLTNYVCVETEIAGTGLLARTEVDWIGDFTTFWATHASMEARRLHNQTLHVALASRMALVRLMAVVVGGAAGLALKAAALPPGGQVLLLPAAWRFANDVLQMLRTSGI